VIADSPDAATDPAPGWTRVGVFGGLYSNAPALEALLEDAARRRLEALVFLGDAGGFGPHPDRAARMLRGCGAVCVQGNYDHSVGNALGDCACGYTDPADNRYARVAYRYTLDGTSAGSRAWLASLPAQLRLRIGGRRVLLCHGSPRRTNEFLWESTSPPAFLGRLVRDAAADAVLVTHTGLHWQRTLPGGELFVNVGALGRPANDGRTCVWYAVLERRPDAAGGGLRAELVPLRYDHEGLAQEMEREDLPPEFVETIRTGWWTTCLEVLPGRERGRGRH
jgi:predicted phosphodiesterase